VAVEGPEHQDETPAVPPGELPGFGKRTGGAPRQASVEADEAENANPKIIVQRQQGCDPLSRLNVAKPQVVVSRRVLDTTRSPSALLAQAGVAPRSAAASSRASE